MLWEKVVPRQFLARQTPSPRKIEGGVEVEEIRASTDQYMAHKRSPKPELQHLLVPE